jgi:hypothetical protein
MRCLVDVVRAAVLGAIIGSLAFVPFFNVVGSDVLRAGTAVVSDL